MKRNIKHFILIVSIIIIFLAGCKKHEDITGDVTAPMISNIKSAVSIFNISPPLFKSTIQWDTDELATSQVEYGLDVSYGAQTDEDQNKVTNHSVKIYNLSPYTIYHFRVKSTDESGNLAMSNDNTFTTPEVMVPHTN